MCISQLSLKPPHTIATLNPRYPAPYINPKALETVKDFTVLISDEGMGGVSRGTGIVLNSTQVLTCAHMLPNPGSEMWIYTHPVSVVRIGTVQYFDRFKDLALIGVTPPIVLSHYPTIQSFHEVGEPIIVVGNILGSMQWFTSYGIIANTYGGFLLTDALIHGGNSGGPWLNYQGDVIGLTDWKYELDGKDTGIGGGISGSTIKQFLNDAKHPNLLQMLFGG